MPFKDREIDPITFLEDIEHTQRSRAVLLRSALERADWRALMFVESTPDRVQHMMYQFADTTHPAYDAAKARGTTDVLRRDAALVAGDPRVVPVDGQARSARSSTSTCVRATRC
jgi:hypothetical protein